jgi:hypothetical protein
MTTRTEYIGLRTAAVLAVLAGLTLSGQGGSHALARGLSSPRPAFAECEGDACAQVSVTFDESKQQYRALNNSPDRWVRVTASNMAASASACLAPGKEAYLPLKSMTGAFHAGYAEARCGEEAASGPPEP